MGTNFHLSLSLLFPPLYLLFSASLHPPPLHCNTTSLKLISGHWPQCCSAIPCYVMKCTDGYGWALVTILCAWVRDEWERERERDNLYLCMRVWVALGCLCVKQIPLMIGLLVGGFGKKDRIYGLLRQGPWENTHNPLLRLVPCCSDTDIKWWQGLWFALLALSFSFRSAETKLIGLICQDAFQSGEPAFRCVFEMRPESEWNSKYRPGCPRSNIICTWQLDMLPW